MIKLIKELLPPKDTPIYVAVSMGVDSLAAYLFLRQKGYDVTALHFNHNLRDQNEDMEKNFLALGETLDESLSISGRASKPLKTENECREARFSFFSERCKDGAVLVTAHHLDDYVESYLLNCFRGQPEYKPIKLYTVFPTFKVVHPFLLTDKQDFIDYMDQSDHRKFIVQDETNSTIKGSRRNWIRNVIVPEMVSQKISLKKRCRLIIQKDLEELDVIN